MAASAVGASALVLFAIFMASDGQVTLTPLICSPAGYDINNLTRADYWKFTTAEKGHCLSGSKCTFYMSLCKKLPDIGAGSSCKDASVCQKSEDTGKFTKVGAYSPGNPFLKLEHSTFWALFSNGANYTTKQNKTCNLAAYYVFVCDKNVPWIPQEGQPGKVVASPVPGKPLVKLDECTYNVTVRYAGACYTLQPAATIAILSAGSVLLILFTIAVVVYCLGGVIYNHCQGADKRHLVPHADFWEELPVNIKEGFRFTFTCGQSRQAKAYEQL